MTAAFLAPLAASAASAAIASPGAFDSDFAAPLQMSDMTAPSFKVAWGGGVEAPNAQDAAQNAVTPPNVAPDTPESNGRLKLKPLLDARYRLEYVDQDGFERNAVANTLSARFGFELQAGEAFTFLVEGEGVANLSGRFNSTTNGATQFPVVADPDEIELNRAQLTFTGIENTAVTVGRQKINHADQRFLGAVAFRQNSQTFDGVRVKTQPTKNLSVDYAYIGRVHRILGDGNPSGNFNGDSHVADTTYKIGKTGSVSGYAYLLDFEEAPGLSSATVGMRAEKSLPLGGDVKLTMRGAYARQWEYGDNPSDYAVSYGKAEAAVGLAPITMAASYERLGGDGANAFQMPLATLHKFQGFADVFLTTPTSGIDDVRLAAIYKRKDVGPFKAVKAVLAVHDFSAAQGGADLGQEIDFVLNGKVNKHLTAELKGGRYFGPDMGPASRGRFWFAVSYAL
ncbi:MAG: alginate export family protein [Pseudomonadota bacterium]